MSLCNSMDQWSILLIVNGLGEQERNKCGEICGFFWVNKSEKRKRRKCQVLIKKKKKNVFVSKREKEKEIQTKIQNVDIVQKEKLEKQDEKSLVMCLNEDSGE